MDEEKLRGGGGGRAVPAEKNINNTFTMQNLGKITCYRGCDRLEKKFVCMLVCFLKFYLGGWVGG